MKKITLAIAIFLCIIFIGLSSTTTLGALSSVPDNTHLSNPTAVAADASTVVVAETLGENTRLHIFTDSGRTTVNNALHGSVQKLRIHTPSNTLYAQQTNKLTLFNLTSSTPMYSIETKNLTAFDINGTTLFTAFSDDEGYQYIKQTPLSGLSETSQITSSTEANELTKTVTDLAASGSQILTLFGDGTKRIYSLNMTATGAYFASQNQTRAITAGTGFWTFGNDTIRINDADPMQLPHPVDDVAYVFDEEFYILDGAQKQICKYKIQNGTFTKAELTLGSNSKDFPLPLPLNTNLTSQNDFTIGRVTGDDAYAYMPEKLGENQSDYGLVGDLALNTQVLVFGGATNGFYYAWNGSKFFFIAAENMDLYDANNPNTQNFITPYAANTLKVPAVAAEKLYRLPQNDASQFIVSGIKQGTKITMLTKLNAFDGGKWSFVSLTQDGETQQGFVLNSAVTDISVPAETFDVYRANPPVFQSLTVYSANDENSAPLTKIKSGGDVHVYEKGEVWSRVKVAVNGSETVGYVLTAQLIQRGTTNTFAAGLVIVIGLLLLGTLTLIFIRRRVKLSPPHDTRSAAFTDLSDSD